MLFGSASAPWAPKAVCAIAPCVRTAPSTTRANSALRNCMNLPDATGTAGCGGEQNSHGESNPAHFSVKTALPGPGLDCQRQPGPANPQLKRRLGRLPVLFPVSYTHLTLPTNR